MGSSTSPLSYFNAMIAIPSESRNVIGSEIDVEIPSDEQ
jgi:hypothetical protein